jgi:DNA-binding GntR family transcriptional regulator
MNATRRRAPARKSNSLVDRVYQEIRHRILEDIWATGHQALEQELALELGVSRTPIREALIRLQRDGLVEVIPRHGMRVLPISPSDVKEIYQILTSLESLAVELAAARKLSAKELEPIERASQDMKAAYEASDMKAWAQADERFHRHLVTLSGNKILTEVVESFWGRAHRARMSMLALRNSPADSTREHIKLLEAIREGDGSLARKTLEAHRTRGASDLSKMLQQYRNLPLLPTQKV